MLMDVPMNKVLRPVFFNQPAEAYKPFVTGIFRIMNMPRRRVGNHNIDTSTPPKCRPQAADNGSHLRLCILVRPAIVPLASFQAEKAYPHVADHPAVHIAATLWWRFLIANVVVAAHIIKGSAKSMCQSGKVCRWQIAAGNDDIDLLAAFAALWLINFRRNDIRYRQNVYASSLLHATSCRPMHGFTKKRIVVFSWRPCMSHGSVSSPGGTRYCSDPKDSFPQQ